MALDLVTPFTKVQLEEEIKDTGRKQVGILGGNFNPVHNAHLVTADAPGLQQPGGHCEPD